MDVSCCTASIVNLCIISYDRYNAITQPLRYARYRTCKRATILVLLVWVYSLGIALPPLLGWHKPHENSDHRICSITQDIGYTFYSTVGAFYLPLCVMVCFYIKIFKVTSRRCQQWERGPGSSRLARQLNFFRNRKSKCTEKKCWCCACCRRSNQTDIELAENPETRRSSSSSSSSTARHSTVCTSAHESHRASLVVSPRQSFQAPQKDLVFQVTQGRRKQTIQRRCLARQISNVTSSDSSNITSSSSTSTTGMSETSFSDSSDPRSRRRVSSVLNNLVAANIIQIAALQEGIRAVKFTDSPRRSVFDAVGEEEEEEEDGEEKVKQTTKEPRQKQIGREDRVPVPETPPRQPRRRKNISLPQERRAVRTLGIVVGCFIICWLPFFIVTLLKPLCQNCFTNEIVYDVVLWLGYFNSACNPVIYTFFNKDFRAAFRKICMCKSTPSPTYL